jgi:hypothetical protein
VPGNRSAILRASSAPWALALSTWAIIKTAKSPARNKVDFIASSRSYSTRQKLRCRNFPSIVVYRLDRLLPLLLEREPLLDERELPDRTLLPRLELLELDERALLLRPLDERPTERPLLRPLDERLTERPLLLPDERCTDRPELDDELFEPVL